MTTPALSFRSGYTIQVRTGAPPAIFTSTYSPWRGEASSAALAVSSEAGRFGSRGGAGVALAAGALEGGAAGGACAWDVAHTNPSEAAAMMTRMFGSFRRSRDILAAERRPQGRM